MEVYNGVPNEMISWKIRQEAVLEADKGNTCHSIIRLSAIYCTSHCKKTKNFFSNLRGLVRRIAIKQARKGV